MAQAPLRGIFIKFLWSIAALIAVLSIGTYGYHIIGGDKYTLLDAFYMTFITLATIGYGRVGRNVAQELETTLLPS